jgi:NAD-dependent DNA ligase
MVKLTLAAFLGSLSIAGATENTFRQVVAAGYDSIEKITDGLTIDALAQLRTEGGVQIGMLRAEKIIKSLGSPRLVAILGSPNVGRFLDMTPPPVLEPVTLKIDLKGKGVAMTGAGPAGREELADKLRAAGAIVQSSVSKNTAYLICESADSTSSKAVKARALGTQVVGYGDVF